MRKLLVLTIALSLFCEVGLSQEAQNRKAGPRRQLATIVFAGLGGAILGLSTLSFYGRPQDQLVNIAIGFAIGIIAGTTYVTIKSATSKDYYNDTQIKLSPPEEHKFSVAPFMTTDIRASNDQSIKPDGGGAKVVLNF